MVTTKSKLQMEFNKEDTSASSDPEQMLNNSTTSVLRGVLKYVNR
jgi:hypothetical protein